MRTFFLRVGFVGFAFALMGVLRATGDSLARI
jgi:hypothetical protein